MQSNRIEFIVEKNEDGMQFDTFLRHGRNVSRRLILRLKRLENGMTRNGEYIRTIDCVKYGDKISLMCVDDKQLTENKSLQIPIVYEDNDVIVFNKPVNMPVHPSLKHQGDTVGNFFAYHCKGLTFRPINRLDRDTSGLCVVAKNAHAANLIGKSLEKTYYAIISGKIIGRGIISEPIGRVSDSIIKREVRSDGQAAVTEYEAVALNERYTLLKINLKTGRTHQIRVHFSYIGHPLVGDDMYGGDTSVMKNQALHCKDVSFLHPLTLKKIALTSELREDMREFMQKSQL